MERNQTSLELTTITIVMNVVQLALSTQMVNWRINSTVLSIKEPKRTRAFPLSVSPSKEMVIAPGKQNIFNLGGNVPTTYRFFRPLLYRLCNALFPQLHHNHPQPALVWPPSAVGTATDDQKRRSWIRFPPRSKTFYLPCAIARILIESPTTKTCFYYKTILVNVL